MRHDADYALPMMPRATQAPDGCRDAADDVSPPSDNAAIYASDAPPSR